MRRSPGSVVAVIAVAAATATAGCSGSATKVAIPPTAASAAEVARAVLTAYQAGDTSTLRALTAGTLRLRPGVLGHISHVRWRSSITENQTYPGFAPGAVYVPFDGITSGSPDHTIPPDKHWTWGFVLARRSAKDRWLAVDEGVG